MWNNDKFKKLMFDIPLFSNSMNPYSPHDSVCNIKDTIRTAHGMIGAGPDDDPPDSAPSAINSLRHG